MPCFPNYCVVSAGAKSEVQPLAIAIGIVVAVIVIVILLVIIIVVAKKKKSRQNRYYPVNQPPGNRQRKESVIPEVREYDNEAVDEIESYEHNPAQIRTQILFDTSREGRVELTSTTGYIEPQESNSDEQVIRLV